MINMKIVRMMRGGKLKNSIYFVKRLPCVMAEDKMQKKTMFSIIIPIYKVEDYLERCVMSVMNQTYRNIEILLIDDGSPDNCPQMCEEFARQDNRIKVIHKENTGVADTRNIGICTATGEYILFLDSDDSIDADTCERFLSVIENNQFPDVVVGRIKRIAKDVTVMNSYPDFRTFTGEEFMLYAFQNSRYFSVAPVNNAYRRQYLLDNKLFFEKGLLYEDERWTPIVIMQAKRLVNTDIEFYNYYIRENSFTTAKNRGAKTVHLIRTVDYLTEQYKYIKNDELRARLMDYLVGLYLHAVHSGDLYAKKEYIKKAFVWENALTKRNKLKAALFCVSPGLYRMINDMEKIKSRDKESFQ